MFVILHWKKKRLCSFKENMLYCFVFPRFKFNGILQKMVVQENAASKNMKTFSRSGSYPWLCYGNIESLEKHIEMPFRCAGNYVIILCIAFAYKKGNIQNS